MYTNRAHVAIPAALTGKEVFMCDNCYHKIRGIYDTYLSKLHNVHWLSDEELKKVCKQSVRLKITNKIKKLGRLKKIIKRKMFDSR